MNIKKKKKGSLWTSLSMFNKKMVKLEHVYSLVMSSSSIRALTKNKEKWYVYNIFTTLLQQILSDRLLLLGQKSNLNVRFKFEPITTNHLWFVVKIL